MRDVTLTAPWSPRLQPAILQMSSPLQFTSVQNQTVQLRPGWLLFYEGNYYDAASSRLRMENDVWASGDGGATWQLLAGVSEWGRDGLVRAASPYYATSFRPRGGSNNCEDPSSDDVYSVAGYVLSANGYPIATNDVWFSQSGLMWYPLSTSFSPGRWYASCDVNAQSHLLLMGGELGGAGGGGGGQMLNDVWAAEQNSFKRQTDRAPWPARGQHLVLVGDSLRLSRELVYVLGGALYFNPSDSSQDRQANDVWASSDEGRTWSFIATAQWPTRYGHTGVITSAGVLLVMGGYHTNPGSLVRQVLNDVWSSFDGGLTWQSCSVEQYTRLTAIRGVQGSTLTDDGYLYLASGARANMNPDLSDVWSSAFSLSNSATLASVCKTQVPTAGIGLASWPPTITPPPTFYVDQTTAVAPWSPRIQPAVLWMYRSITYTQVGTNRQITTGSPWLILFEGSLTDWNGMNENDVWASVDEGRTWDLISGISRMGRTGLVESSLPDASFEARGGSSNCEDPTSDTVYSIGGINQDQTLSNAVWRSDDGLHWSRVLTPTFSPARWFSSCDVNNQGHLLSMGGVGPENALLNDVWLMQSAIWTRVAEHAAWPARCEHLVLVGDSPLLKVEVTYVLGGATVWEGGGASSAVSNDVWASMDEGATWALVTATAAWPSRWGHSGVVTSAGVLLVFGGTTGGTENTYVSYRDMWASFDGGVSWSQCAVEGGATNGWIRGEQGSTLTEDEYLLLAGGYFYNSSPAREDQLRDAWLSTFSLADSDRLARICNTTIPSAGIGLQKWPGGVQLTFAATQVLRQTPFSWRIQPALLTMYNPITYTQVDTMKQVSTGSPWLLMYEGTLAYPMYDQVVQENDVWASSNEGRTWDLISGISYFGSSGLTPAVLYASSFTPRAGSTNCEDPTSDVVYSLGGYLTEGADGVVSNQVWQSDDALVWRLVQSDTFAPARFFSSCDVNSQQLLLVMGGSAGTFEYLNDVWHATGKGNTWTRITEHAPWPARAEHLVLVGTAPLLGKELVYVIGGFQDDPTASNDVWASSDDGVTWQFIAIAPFGPRWGHGGVITSAGAIMVFGGTNTNLNALVTYHDAWLSFNGGLTWSSCVLSSGDGSVFIRGEQAVALTAREELLIASGYSYNADGGRTDFRDMWQTQFSLADISALAVMCRGAVPAAGIGLAVWPTNQTVPVRPPQSSSTGGSGTSGSGGNSGSNDDGTGTVDNGGGGGGGGTNMTALIIVLCVLVGVAAVGAVGYRWWKRRGSGGRFGRLDGGGGALDLSEWSGRNREFSDSSVAEWAGLSRGGNSNTNGSSGGGGGGGGGFKRWGGGGWGSSSSSTSNGNGSASDNYYTNSGSSSSSNHGSSKDFSRGGNSLLSEEPYQPPNAAIHHNNYSSSNSNSSSSGGGGGGGGGGDNPYTMELSGRRAFDPLGASSRQVGHVSGGWGGPTTSGDPLGGRPVHGSDSGSSAGDPLGARDPFGISAAGRMREWQ